MKPSPFTPVTYPVLPPLSGVSIGVGACGLKYTDRPDLSIIAFPAGTTVAGVFTRSTTAGPPVEWCRAAAEKGNIRAIVTNAGNANAFTGKIGRAVVSRTAQAAAELLNCSQEEIFVCSTGVIGVPPSADKLTEFLPSVYANRSEDAWRELADAIMTTDTYPKVAHRSVRVGDTDVRINAVAKGSGMLMPDMATMLVYIATDAAVKCDALHSILKQACRKSFHCITVDGDTSTSDTVLFAATATAGNIIISDLNEQHAKDFVAAVNSLCMDLSHQIVKDGEGASKFIEVEVFGAVSDESASRIAFSIANSLLVKTAIAGGDPNWGRVVMAAGRSLEPINQDLSEVWFAGEQVAVNGERLSQLNDDLLRSKLFECEIPIRMGVGDGPGSAKVWTCDLTHEYININGTYCT